MKNIKKHPFTLFIKIIMIILTVIFCVLMVMLAGVGIVYNAESYGEQLESYGKLMILSGILMTSGSILCIPRKTFVNIVSVVFSCSGFALCMAMLYKICDHADRAGWSDKYNMTPISDMYKARIIPCAVPVAIAVVVALIQIFSYEASQERYRKKLSRMEKENAPAPKIIDDD